MNISQQVLEKYQPLAILLNSPDSSYAPSRNVLLDEVRRALSEITDLREMVADQYEKLELCDKELTMAQESIIAMREEQQRRAIAEVTSAE